MNNSNLDLAVMAFQGGVNPTVVIDFLARREGMTPEGAQRMLETELVFNRLSLNCPPMPVTQSDRERARRVA